MKSPRRPRPNGLDRLIRTLRQISKYSLTGALAALAGCVPSPDLIGVSPDGRYIVLPVNQAGIAAVINDASAIVRIDLKTNDVQVIGPNRAGAFWMNIAKDTIAFGQSGTAGSEPSIVIHSGNETPVIIKNAIFPAVAPDGSAVIYADSTTFTEPSHTNSRLMKYDIKTGKTTDLKLKGTAPQFSPDGKQFLFVTNDDSRLTVATADVDGASSKIIAAIAADLPNVFRPRWVDAKTILYRAKTADTGDDAELFLHTLGGKPEQVTANDVEDVTPVFAGKDRIIWRELPISRQLQYNDDVLPLWISEKKDGKWSSRSLGVSALTVSVIGDDMIYVGVPAEGSGITLHRCPIATPEKITDLGAMIKEKVKDLPASTGGR